MVDEVVGDYRLAGDLQAQAWVDKGAEARVVVLGERMFTILINATSTAAHVDWRADFDALTYELIDTPPEVEAGVRAYMKALGLAYAALAFGIEKDTGRLAFYESNSLGQYGWLEAQIGAPITAALADLLAGACSRRPPWTCSGTTAPPHSPTCSPGWASSPIPRGRPRSATSRGTSS